MFAKKKNFFLSIGKLENNFTVLKVRETTVYSSGGKKILLLRKCEEVVLIQKVRINCIIEKVTRKLCGRENRYKCCNWENWKKIISIKGAVKRYQGSASFLMLIQWR